MSAPYERTPQARRDLITYPLWLRPGFHLGIGLLAVSIAVAGLVLACVGLTSHDKNTFRGGLSAALPMVLLAAASFARYRDARRANRSGSSGNKGGAFIMDAILIMFSLALLAVASCSVSAAASAPAARHNFSHDYLIGTWNCTVQAANGLGTKRTNYKAIQGGAALAEGSTTTWATGRTSVEQSRITDNAGYFRWLDVYTNKGWQSQHWFVKGVIHWDNFLGSGGRTMTLTQVNPKKYTAEIDSLMNPPIVTTCLRQS